MLLTDGYSGFVTETKKVTDRSPRMLDCGALKRALGQGIPPWVGLILLPLLCSVMGRVWGTSRGLEQGDCGSRHIDPKEPPERLRRSQRWFLQNQPDTPRRQDCAFW